MSYELEAQIIGFSHALHASELDESSELLSGETVSHPQDDSAQDSSGGSDEGVQDYAVAVRGGAVAAEPRLTSLFLETDSLPSALRGVPGVAALANLVRSRKQAAQARNALVSHHAPLLGEAYSFAGSAGQVTVRLLCPVRVSAVELVYVFDADSSEEREQQQAAHNSAAPREVTVVGFRQKNRLGEADQVQLGQFNFNKPADLEETRSVNGTLLHSQSLSISAPEPMRAVTVAVRSNHGNEQVTKLHRVKVWGELVGSC